MAIHLPDVPRNAARAQKQFCVEIDNRPRQNSAYRPTHFKAVFMTAFYILGKKYYIDLIGGFDIIYVKELMRRITMNKLNKILAGCLVLIMLFICVGCKGGEEKLTPVKVSEIREVNGKMVPYYLGNPYLFYPVHMRYDHIKDYIDNELADSVLEQAIKKVKESGFEAVMLYVQWQNIYDGKEYDLTWFTKQFELAVKYDLKVHIVWTGSNNCGFGGYMPWQTDYEKYPSLMENGKPKLSTVDNSRTPDFSAPIFLEEESEGIRRICDWLNKNDKDRRTVAIQLEDEPCGWGGGYGYWMSQFKVYVAYLNGLAKAVKEGNYSMIAYVNIASSTRETTVDGYDYDGTVRYIMEQEYIDFVGVSYYGDSTTPGVVEFEKDGNFPVFVGFSAATASLPGQTVYSLSNGYGMCYYQLINLVTGQDSGLFRCQENVGNFFVERDGSKPFVGDGFSGSDELVYTEFVNMMKSMFKMDELLALTTAKNIKAFNNKLKNDTTTSQRIDGEKIKFTYSQPDKKYGGCGLMLKADDGNYYGFATQTASYLFPFDITVTEGEYKEGKWVSSGEVTVSDNTFVAEAGKAYQIIAK